MALSVHYFFFEVGVKPPPTQLQSFALSRRHLTQVDETVAGVVESPCGFKSTIWRQVDETVAGTAESLEIKPIVCKQCPYTTNQREILENSAKDHENMKATPCL